MCVCGVVDEWVWLGFFFEKNVLSTIVAISESDLSTKS